MHACSLLDLFHKHRRGGFLGIRQDTGPNHNYGVTQIDGGAEQRAQQL